MRSIRSIQYKFGYLIAATFALLSVSHQALAAQADSLAADVVEVGNLTGILPALKQLRTEQETAKRSQPKNDSVDSIVRNQRIIYLHGKINQYEHTINLEVSSVLGKLNSGMAELADRKALLADQRARQLRKQSFINLVSGGLTKIGGYSSALSVTSTAIPTNLLEVFDGIVQTSLSAFTLKQQRAERRTFHAEPTILTAFIKGTNEPLHEYPETVWKYLNAKTDGKKSRREVLLDHWLSTGRLTSNKKKRTLSNAGVINTYNQLEVGEVRVTFDDLDDSVAMMSDVKSVVSGIENSLMELSHVLKASYEDDPSIVL